MRLFGWASVVIAALTPPATCAQADSWCIRDAEGITAPICAFSSAEDCIRAAIIGPSGIVCMREQPDPALVKARKKKPRARRRRLVGRTP